MIAQVNGVDQVAVMGNSQRYTPVGNHERLGVGDGGFTGGGVAHMAHSQMTREALQVGFGKNLRYQSHVFVQRHCTAVTGDNACTFLAPML